MLIGILVPTLPENIETSTMLFLVFPKNNILTYNLPL